MNDLTRTGLEAGTITPKMSARGVQVHYGTNHALKDVDVDILDRTVTAFTISHSLTLTAATLGWVHIPPPPVEAVIALSIVFVAAEIVRQRRGIEGITARAPWVVAFSFGLMHGLGFAGGLSEAGLLAGHIPSALHFFSLGVETGHLLFIGVVLAFIALVRRSRIPLPRWTELVPPYAIGGIAMFWTIQRLSAF